MIAVPGSGPGRQAGGYRRSRIPAVIAVIVATARQLAVILPVILPPASPAVHRCPPADCQLQRLKGQGLGLRWFGFEAESGLA